jgi:urease accessory protein UreF
MPIKFAHQTIREARSRIAALDRELAALQRSIRCLPSNHHLSRELREQAIRLGEERCKAFRDLLELLELAEMPAEEMGSA